MHDKKCDLLWQTCIITEVYFFVVMCQLIFQYREGFFLCGTPNKRDILLCKLVERCSNGPEISHKMPIETSEAKETPHLCDRFGLRPTLNNFNLGFMKVLGALVNPKGMTNHSYKPNLVLNAVFHSSPNFIRIWWYPLRESTLENIVEPLNSSSISSSLGIGWQ